MLFWLSQAISFFESLSKCSALQMSCLRMQASMSSKAAPTEKSEPVTQDSQLKREKAPKPSKPEVSAEELEERKEARNKSTQARADKEATFLRLLEDQQKEVISSSEYSKP